MLMMPKNIDIKAIRYTRNSWVIIVLMNGCMNITTPVRILNQKYIQFRIFQKQSLL